MRTLDSGEPQKVLLAAEKPTTYNKTNRPEFVTTLLSLSRCMVSTTALRSQGQSVRLDHFPSLRSPTPLTLQSVHLFWRLSFTSYRVIRTLYQCQLQLWRNSSFFSIYNRHSIISSLARTNSCSSGRSSFPYSDGEGSLRTMFWKTCSLWSCVSWRPSTLGRHRFFNICQPTWLKVLEENQNIL